VIDDIGVVGGFEVLNLRTDFSAGNVTLMSIAYDTQTLSK
jgi:hypothetical protein